MEMSARFGLHCTPFTREITVDHLFPHPQRTAALEGLKQNGEVSPVIEGRDGFYLLRLIERRESTARGNAARQDAAVASHRAQIERRRAIENTVLAELRDRIPVQYHTNALDEVRSAWRAGQGRRDDVPSAPPGGGRP